MLFPSKKFSRAGFGILDFFGTVAALPTLSRSIARSEPSVPRLFLRPPFALCPSLCLCPLFSEGVWWLVLGTQSLGFSVNSDMTEALWLCWGLAK